MNTKNQEITCEALDKVISILTNYTSKQVGCRIVPVLNYRAVMATRNAALDIRNNYVNSQRRIYKGN